MAEKLEVALKKEVEAAELSIKTVETDIKKAKLIGVDVRSQESELEAQKKQLALVKQVYNL